MLHGSKKCACITIHFCDGVVSEVQRVSNTCPKSCVLCHKVDFSLGLILLMLSKMDCNEQSIQALISSYPQIFLLKTVMKHILFAVIVP